MFKHAYDNRIHILEISIKQFVQLYMYCIITIRLIILVSDWSLKNTSPTSPTKHHHHPTISFQVTYNDLKGIRWVPCIRHGTNSYTYTNCHGDIGTSRPFAQNRHNDNDQGIDTRNLEGDVEVMKLENSTSRTKRSILLWQLSDIAVFTVSRPILKFLTWSFMVVTLFGTNSLVLNS